MDLGKASYGWTNKRRKSFEERKVTKMRCRKSGLTPNRISESEVNNLSISSNNNCFKDGFLGAELGSRPAAEIVGCARHMKTSS